MLVKWRRDDWQTFKGTWLIVSNVLSDDEVCALIAGNPDKYGDWGAWDKVSD